MANHASMTKEELITYIRERGFPITLNESSRRKVKQLSKFSNQSDFWAHAYEVIWEDKPCEFKMKFPIIFKHKVVLDEGSFEIPVIIKSMDPKDYSLDIGDCLHELLPNKVFEEIKEEVEWQIMFH